ETYTLLHMTKLLLTTTCLALAVVVGAQSPRVFTNDDYARAESMLVYNTEPLIDRGSVSPNWVSGGVFWYRILTPTGIEYVLVDAAKKSKTNFTEKDKLAQAISAATGKPFEASAIVEGRRGRGGRGGGGLEVPSPDGKRAAFIRDWNLWVKEV